MHNVVRLTNNAFFPLQCAVLAKWYVLLCFSVVFSLYVSSLELLHNMF